MGCGTSKAAQINEENITIKDYPTSSSPHHHTRDAEQVNEVPSSDGLLTIDDEHQPISPELSGQSEIERAVQNFTVSEPPRITEDNAAVQGHEHVTVSSTDASQRPILFEVSMSSDGAKGPKKLPPRLLAKMDSSTKVTAEELATKQKIVEERKQKELDKRANSKASRKERLRKEVMAAREMEQLSNERLQIDSNNQTQSEEHTKNIKNRINGESSDYFQGSYDASAEIEVDATFNTDQEQQFGLWDDNDTQEQSTTKDEQTKHGDIFDDQSLTNSLEQYM